MTDLIKTEQQELEKINRHQREDHRTIAEQDEHTPLPQAAVIPDIIHLAEPCFKKVSYGSENGFMGSREQRIPVESIDNGVDERGRGDVM